jgi:uncharacterized protein YfaS (alpha-2-macroglobulin family)
MAVGKDEHASDFARCFASLVVSLSGQRTDTLEPVLRDLYARRAKYSDEMRAFLAVAMHTLGVLETQREQLLREIDRSPPSFSFDPKTFSSVSRSEAIRAWAFATIHPEDSTGKAREKLRARIALLLEDSVSLSTQENFWLLMAFRQLHSSSFKVNAPLKRFAPAPDRVSKNGHSVSWAGISLQDLREFSPRAERGTLQGMSVLWDAQFRMTKPEEDRRLDRGLRVERTVVNRTDPSRTGSKDAPFRLGDELVVTFRLATRQEHHYVALETELPACFESVNAAIPSVARSFRPVVLKDELELDLAYSQLRDSTVNLYFDQVEPGVGVSSTIVRVTSAGTFTWPPTQVTPMYDSRFSGLSAGSVCYVVE